MSIYSCYEDIRRYNALKANLGNVIATLNNASSKLSPVSQSIYAAYSVDENPTPIVGRLDGLTNDVASTASYISRVIIPAIDHAISNKRREIFRLEQEEKAKASSGH